MTDIMAEVSNASAEQAQGVTQVGDAVAQMDQATQRNAAMVEQMANAATRLNAQAQALVNTVAVFRLAPGIDLFSSVTPKVLRSAQRCEAQERGFFFAVIACQGIPVLLILQLRRNTQVPPRARRAGVLLLQNCR
ncbi:MAG: hypothetical protein IPN53_16565 [Comamonadaceae bacterium]|nr:hypothetical protein [Comamonadaceae bacterium]